MSDKTQNKKPQKASDDQFAKMLEEYNNRIGKHKVASEKRACSSAAKVTTLRLTH